MTKYPLNINKGTFQDSVIYKMLKIFRNVAKFSPVLALAFSVDVAAFQFKSVQKCQTVLFINC